MVSVPTAGLRRVCDECKGQMAWDAAAGKLKCESCGAMRDAEPGQLEAAARQDLRIVEYDLQSALSAKPTGTMGVGTREVKCKECGAVVEFPDKLQATKCDFCGSPQVLAQEARGDHYRPESLVPFAVNRDTAVSSFKSWQGKLWFRPSNLRQKSSVSELRGVYIPYWTFDCAVHSNWTADAGYYYYEDESYTTTENGKTVTKTRKVRKVRWVPTRGQRDDAYDDWLCCASKGVPENLWRGVSKFTTQGLVAYAPEYLQGFSAESYAIELPDAWKQSQGEIADEQERRCSKDVPGDTQRNLAANHQFSRATFKHCLLPLWIAAYRYNGKVYRFLVNGQNGQVNGTAPYSVFKIAALVLAILGAIIAFLVLRAR